MTLIDCFWSGTRRLAASSLLLVLVPAIFAQTPIRDGDQFLVNTYTSDDQRNPSVAVDSEGAFVVVWESDWSDNGDSDGSIQGQRFSSDGTLLGSQFRVNTYTPHVQLYPSVSSATGGDFVVVWGSANSDNGDSSGFSIQGKRYSSDGTAVGDEFLVNTYTTGHQSSPSVAVASGDGFVIVWHSDGSSGDDSSYGSVQARRYASDATPLGTDFQVNTYTTGRQRYPAMAVAPGCCFVIVWMSDQPSTGGDSDIFGQRYYSDGSPLGGEFLVNTYTTDDQIYPSVSASPAGDFVVVWDTSRADNGDTSHHSIQGQRFSSDGTPLGEQFLVNTYTTNNQFFPSVAVASSGDFVVAWESYGSDNGDTSFYTVQGQRFASDGSRTGGQFRVNTHALGYQNVPVVAVERDDDFVVVWEDYGSDYGDGSGSGIQGQRFRLRLFEDGFESGDTGNWSFATP